MRVAKLFFFLWIFKLRTAEEFLNTKNVSVSCRTTVHASVTLYKIDIGKEGGTWGFDHHWKVTSSMNSSLSAFINWTCVSTQQNSMEIKWCSFVRFNTHTIVASRKHGTCHFRKSVALLYAWINTIHENFDSKARSYISI